MLFADLFWFFFLIWHYQSIDEYILRELELMEKELDLDDILSYRSAAEHELQVYFSLNILQNSLYYVVMTKLVWLSF